MAMRGRWLWALAAAGLAVGLLVQAQTAADAVREGIDLCLRAVIPSLFPFFAVSSLLVSLGAAAMGRVCAFVVFFLVLLRLAETATGPWSAPAAGFMELTNGILRLTPDRRGFVTAAALLGWGGLSVHCQTAAVTAGSGIPMGRYLPAKAVQAALSAGLAWLAAPHLLP